MLAMPTALAETVHVLSSIGVTSATKVLSLTLKGSNPSFDENNIVPGTQLCVIPTPCAPPCESDKQVIIPDGVVGIVAVAEYYTVSANDSYNTGIKFD